MDTPLGPEPQITPPTVTAKDVQTMTTADLIAYRSMPARMREVLSLMSAGDLIKAFGLS